MSDELAWMQKRAERAEDERNDVMRQLDVSICAEKVVVKDLERAEAKLAEVIAALEYCVSDVRHPRYEFPGAKLDAPVSHWSHTGPQDGIHQCPRCVLERALVSAKGPR